MQPDTPPLPRTQRLRTTSRPSVEQNWTNPRRDGRERESQAGQRAGLEQRSGRSAPRRRNANANGTDSRPECARRLAATGHPRGGAQTKHGPSSANAVAGGASRPAYARGTVAGEAHAHRAVAGEASRPAYARDEVAGAASRPASPLTARLNPDKRNRLGQAQREGTRSRRPRRKPVTVVKRRDLQHDKARKAADTVPRNERASAKPKTSSERERRTGTKRRGPESRSPQRPGTKPRTKPREEPAAAKSKSKSQKRRERRQAQQERRQAQREHSKRPRPHSDDNVPEGQQRRKQRTRRSKRTTERAAEGVPHTSSQVALAANRASDLAKATEDIRAATHTAEESVQIAEHALSAASAAAAAAAESWRARPETSITNYFRPGKLNASLKFVTQIPAALLHQMAEQCKGGAWLLELSNQSTWHNCREARRLWNEVEHTLCRATVRAWCRQRRVAFLLHATERRTSLGDTDDVKIAWMDMPRLGDRAQIHGRWPLFSADSHQEVYELAAMESLLQFHAGFSIYADIYMELRQIPKSIALIITEYATDRETCEAQPIPASMLRNLIGRTQHLHVLLQIESAVHPQRTATGMLGDPDATMRGLMPEFLVLGGPTNKDWYQRWTCKCPACEHTRLALVSNPSSIPPMLHPRPQPVGAEEGAAPYPFQSHYG